MWKAPKYGARCSIAQVETRSSGTMGCSHSRAGAVQDGDNNREVIGNDTGAPQGGQRAQEIRTLRVPFTEQSFHCAVNLRKESLKLTKDTAKPGSYALQFSTDCERPCKCSVFIMAYEKEPKSFMNERPKRLKSKFTQREASITFTVDVGLNQIYKTPTGQGLSFDSLQKEELSAEKAHSDQIFPLVIRIQTLPDPGESREEAAANIHALTTFASLTPTDDGFDIQVLKQMIWVQGQPLVLNEIYDGHIGSVPQNSDGQPVAADKDCRICMDKPRNTLAMPCRHLFACTRCAEEWGKIHDVCIICRAHVESFLSLQLPGAEKKDLSEVEGQDGDEQYSTDELAGNGVPAAESTV